MSHDTYFYEHEADSYSFIRVPYTLITDQRFRHIDPVAKLLYGLLLSRMALSRKNNWFDKAHRVFIYFTIEEICNTMQCKRDKAMKLLRQLEDVKLICRTRQGLNKPDFIYVLKFTEVEKTDLRKSEKSTSRSR